MPKSRMQEFLELLDECLEAAGDVVYAQTSDGDLDECDESFQESRARLITFIEKEFENRTPSR